MSEPGQPESRILWTVFGVTDGVAKIMRAIVLMVAKGRVRQTLWNVGYILGELMRFRPPYLRRSSLDVRHPGALTMPHGMAIAAGTVFCLLAARIS